MVKADLSSMEDVEDNGKWESIERYKRIEFSIVYAYRS